MRKLRFAFGVVLLPGSLMLVSCISRQKCQKYYPPQIIKTDSVTVTVKETLHDTTVVLQDDSSFIKAWIECDSAGRAIMKELVGYKSGSRANLPRVKIEGNLLTAECKCDSAVIHAIFKSREIITERSRDHLEIPPPVEVKYIPGWMWFFGITGMICWLFGLLWVAYRVIIGKIIKTRI